MEKNQKRAIIVAVYLAIFIILGLFFYSLFKPKETCTDSIKNQNEEDVDCGGVCAPCKKIEAQPLNVLETGIVPSGITDQYDFYAIIDNPNNIYGSKEFQYEIKLKDAQGNILVDKTDSSYILPGEKKYIVETNLAPGSLPASAEIQIKNSEWVEFNDYRRPEIEVVNKNYSEITSGVGFADARGLLKNGSPFDFDLITIRIILKDPQNRVIALNSTQMRTVKSGEERDFRAFWPNRFPGDVRNMEAQVEVNVFSSDTFLKRYFKAQKFQEY